MELFRYRGPRLPRRAPPVADAGPGMMIRIASAPDPAAFLQRVWSSDGPLGEAMLRSLPVGLLSNDGWACTVQDTHLLALGPPRSAAGKTASVIIPTILTARGPVVSATTKPDVIAGTAIARAQKGQVWCYAPDGQTRIPDGVKELRWSPLEGCKDWAVALRTATEMVRSLPVEDMRGGSHWRDRGSALLAPVFHYAAKSGHDMRHVRDAVYEFLSPVGKTTTGGWIRTWLNDHGSPDAASQLNSVLDAGREERGSIMSTASRALRVYQIPKAIESTVKPNFDPMEFVRGGIAGRADTVYILSMGEDQEDVAPLVVALLGRIREATYKVHRERQPEDSVVFALDELYNLAPIPTLPAMLTDGGSQGLLVVGAVQDLTLIKSRWPKEADSFLTTFGNVMVFPGIRDGKTLDAVSKLIGDHDVEKESWGRGGTQYSTRREPIHPPSQLYAGIGKGNPDVCVYLNTQVAWEPARATPYWRSPPFPAVLTSYLVRAVSGRVPEWRFDEAEVTDERPDVVDVLPRLPMPDLSAWSAQWQSDRHDPWQRYWAQTYAAVLPEIRRRREREPGLASWEPDPS